MRLPIVFVEEGDCPMSPTSTCMRATCNTVTPGTVKTCPACGGKTMTSRRIVVLGWVLLAIGLALVVGMGTIAWNVWASMAHPGIRQADGTTFTGTAEQAHEALQLFFGVIAFGVLAGLNGLYQIVTGRRSLVFAMLTIAIAAAIFFAARGMIAPGGSFAD